jgi:hypothetical protein
MMNLDKSGDGRGQIGAARGMTNKLYYGNNLDVLRASVASESVDLIYLDPPFNSNASYNVLFKAPSGAQSQAQIEPFDDTWHWNESAERAFDSVLSSGNSDAAIMLKAMRSALGENDMMAYLAMMAVRLIELRRVLRVALSSLRSDREPLSQGFARRDIRARCLPKRDYLETHHCS